MVYISCDLLNHDTDLLEIDLADTPKVVTLQSSAPCTEPPYVLVGLEQNLWQFLWSDLLMLLEYMPGVRVRFLVLFMCTSCQNWLKAAKAATHTNHF